MTLTEWTQMKTTFNSKFENVILKKITCCILPIHLCSIYYKDSEYFPLDILSNVLRDSTATVILGYNLQ